MGLNLASLGIDARSRPLAASLFLQSFLLGIPQLFTASAAAALFLDSFSAHDLSYVIMAGGVLVPSLGLAFSAALPRLGARRGLRLVLMSLIGGLAAIAAGLALSGGAPAARVALIVWVDVEYAFTELAFASHANRVLDIRQAKRLFGIIGAGQVLAATVGGAIAPLALRVVPVEGLLGLSLLGLAGAWANFERMGRRHPLEEAEAERGEASVAATSRAPLARFIFVLVAAEYVVQSFSEILFYNGLQATRPDAGAMASFLALFFAVAGAVKLVVDFAASGRFLARFGVRGGLLVPALAMALPLLVSVGISLGGGSASDSFLPLLAARFLQTVALGTLYAPAYFTLYQPLRPAIRSSAQALADTVVGQGGAGLGGLFLLLILNVLGLGFSAVGIAALAFIALWAIAAVLAERGYRFLVMKRAQGDKAGHASDSSAETSDGVGDVQDALEALASEPCHGERAEALERLFRSGRRLDGNEGEAVEARWRRALECEAGLCERYHKTARAMDERPLSSALEREAAKAAERAILVLGLAYPRDAIGALRHGLLLAEGGERAYALELAESTLDGPDRSLIIPLFEGAHVERSREAGSGPPSASLLRELADESERGAQTWLRSLSVLELRGRAEASSNLSAAELRIAEEDAPLVDRTLALAKAPIFSSVPHEDLSALARGIGERRVAAGVRFITQGEEGSELFLLVSGRVEVSVGGTRVATMGPGEVVGELSALSPEPRSADVAAIEDSRLLVVGGEELRAFTAERWRTALEILKVLDLRVVTTLASRCPADGDAPAERGPAAGKRHGRAQSAGQGTSLDDKALGAIPLLQNLPGGAIETLRRRAFVVAAAAGRRVHSMGDEARDLCFVVKGRIALERGGRTALELGPGEVFGDTEAVLAERRLCDAIALEPSELLTIPRRALTDLVWDGSAFLRGLTLAAADRLRRVTRLPHSGRG